MLTGAQIAETLAMDTEGPQGMSEAQLQTLREYVAERLPAVVETLLDLPVTYGTCCQTTAACLRDMVKQGTIIKIMIDAPCCCGGITPQFCEVVNREYDQIANRLETVSMSDDLSEEADRLAEFGLKPDLVDQAVANSLTIGQALAAQPFLFLHPHNR